MESWRLTGLKPASRSFFSEYSTACQTVGFRLRNSQKGFVNASGFPAATAHRRHSADVAAHETLWRCGWRRDEAQEGQTVRWAGGRASMSEAM